MGKKGLSRLLSRHRCYPHSLGLYKLRLDNIGQHMVLTVHYPMAHIGYIGYISYVFRAIQNLTLDETLQAADD